MNKEAILHPLPINSQSVLLPCSLLCMQIFIHTAVSLPTFHSASQRAELHLSTTFIYYITYSCLHKCDSKYLRGATHPSSPNTSFLLCSHVCRQTNKQAQPNTSLIFLAVLAPAIAYTSGAILGGYSTHHSPTSLFSRSIIGRRD